MTTLRVTLGLGTLIVWLLLIVVDLAWQDVLREAAQRREGHYGELFGPLSFFRPVLFWTAAVLSVATAILFLRNPPLRDNHRLQLTGEARE